MSEIRLCWERDHPRRCRDSSVLSFDQSISQSILKLFSAYIYSWAGLAVPKARKHDKKWSKSELKINITQLQLLIFFLI